MDKRTKRFNIGVMLVMGIVLCKDISALCTLAAQVTPDEQKSLVIALDPGHGGDEDGAESYGMKEKNINLELARLVKQGLEGYDNITVILTHDTDEKVGLTERAERAAKADADILISLHCNASVSHVSHGAQVYVSTGQKYCKELQDFADYFMGEFEALGLDNAGVFARVTQSGARRDDGSFDDYYGVIRHSYNRGIPAMIVEHCYMDSAEDVHYVKDYEELKRLAQADVNAIAAYYQLTDSQGDKVKGKHAEKYGGTTKGRILGCYESPRITGIELVNYEGKSPGIATYNIHVEDGCGISYIYLIYRNDTGDSITVPLMMNEPLTTGTYEIKGVIPQGLKEGYYRLSFAGAYNRAGYDAGYNYCGGTMIGYGKCDWLNEFICSKETGLSVKEQVNLPSAHIERISAGLSEGIKNRRPITKIGLRSD